MSLNKRAPYDFLFENAPIAAAILEAGTLKLKAANRHMLELWARPASIIDTHLLDFMPELAGQPYPKYLEKVARTRKPIAEKGATVFLNRFGKEELVFMDYSYTPIGESNQANAILIVANDVCERELNKLVAQQADQNLRAIVMSAPVAMCVFDGPGFKIEIVNYRMMDLWQSTRTMNLKALSYVYHSGISYGVVENGIQYSYTPLFNAAGRVAKVSVMAFPTLNS